MLIDSCLRVGSPDNFIDYEIVDDVHVEIVDGDAFLIDRQDGRHYIDYGDSEVTKESLVKSFNSAKGVTGFLSKGKFILDSEKEVTYDIHHYDLEVIIRDEDCYFDSSNQTISLLREELDPLDQEDEDEEEIL